MASRPLASPDSLDQPLSFWTKMAFGAGDLGPAITANVIIFFQLLFFTNVAGIPASLAGSILFISKIWDAINDPLVGVLTDKTKSARWGRRLPWLLYGAIPFGLFFFLLWLVPGTVANEAVCESSGQITSRVWWLFAYYVVIGAISQMFYTVVNLPYTAMTPELTQDFDERTQLNSFRFAFSIGGSILSLVLALVIFQMIPADQKALQYIVLAALCGVIAVLGLYWCVFGTRKRALAFEKKRSQQPKPKEIPFLQQFKIALSNRPFLFVIGIYLCSWLAVQLTATIIPYFVIDWMKLDKPMDFPLVLIVVQGTALLMLFPWSQMSRRYGKQAVYFMGMGFWIIAQFGLFFLQPGQTILMYIFAIMAGVGVSTAYLIPWSMIPDVIDSDELQTGQRREGIFYGFMVLLQKLGLALGLFLVGIALDTSGFVEAIAGCPRPTQPDSALESIRFVIGPVPTICLLMGLVLTYFYPINRNKHAEIMLKLKERNSQSGS